MEGPTPLPPLFWILIVTGANVNRTVNHPIGHSRLITDYSMYKLSWILLKLKVEFFSSELKFHQPDD